MRFSKVLSTRIGVLSALASLVFTKFLVSTSAALADGVFMKKVGEAASVVASPKQEALIVRDGDKVQVTLRTHFRAGPSELAWVVPVPKKPDKIEKANDQVFQVLQEYTAPQFWAIGRSGFGCGCSGSGSAVATRSVSVLEIGSAGIFDYTVLSATGSDALTKWLGENGYAVPANSADVIRHYVDEGWYWLAIRVQAEAAKEPTLAPHPIRYSYRHDGKVVYPLVISRLSADRENEIVLYVLSTGGPFGCENWRNITISNEQLKLDKSSPSGTNYEALLHEAIQREGGHAFVIEFASHTDIHEYLPPYRPLWEVVAGMEQYNGYPYEREFVYLTRLRTVIPPEEMDRDVTLMQLPDYPVLHSHRIRVSSNGGDGTGAIATLACMGLIFLAYFSLRYRIRGIGLVRIRRSP